MLTRYLMAKCNGLLFAKSPIDAGAGSARISASITSGLLPEHTAKCNGVQPSPSVPKHNPFRCFKLASKLSMTANGG